MQGDPARLRQVIHNFLQNAEQAIAERSRPAHHRAHAAWTGRRARLSVLDNGRGFPPEMLARAFEPYVTTKAKGTGLGLAIVKKIVEEHNGSIEIAQHARRRRTGQHPSAGARVRAWSAQRQSAERASAG